jgi:hypothetical protein
MKRGVPPTARKARTGEFTPPGITALARLNNWADSVALTSASLPHVVLIAQSWADLGSRRTRDPGHKFDVYSVNVQSRGTVLGAYEIANILILTQDQAGRDRQADLARLRAGPLPHNAGVRRGEVLHKGKL